MNQDTFNTFCGTLPATSYVSQWGGADVWKIGQGKSAKVFAIGWFGNGKYAGITFKVSPLAYEVLKDQPGLRPAPYFASRGIKWIQHYSEPGLPDPALKEHLAESHRLVAMAMSKSQRRKLDLYEDESED